MKYWVTEVFRNLKLWQKFLIYVLILIVIMTLLMCIMVIKLNTVNSAYQEILNNVVTLNRTYNLLERSLTELEQYLTAGISRSNEKFNTVFDELYRSINAMPLEFSTEEEQLAYNNIRGMLISLSQQADYCISAIRGRDALLAVDYYEQIKLIADDMKEAINYLVTANMSMSQDLYTILESDTARSIRSSWLAIGLVMAFGIINTITFSKSMTHSLTLLTRQSVKIAEHPEDVHTIDIKSNDEIGQLAFAFNQMSSNIRKYIDELNEKAMIEKMLNSAELRALQSQINPHFLFNTLNCIAQTAMKEEADDTYMLILNVSNMLRYNLRRMDAPVRFGDEIENLKRYIMIQKMRYGEDRIQYYIDIEDESVYEMTIPCLTIQPIVENAIIHGFENSEKKGWIRVSAKRIDDLYEIKIEDNGAGMNSETLARIMGKMQKNSPIIGHSTGIGIHNVAYRLTLLYGRDVFSITSEEGAGTCVILHIPVSYGSK